MKLGFICPNVPGHLNPMTALARRLQARHHEVVFLYASDAAGLPVVDIDERDDFNESRPEASKMQGEEALQFSLGMVMARTETILKSLPAIVASSGVDAIIVKRAPQLELLKQTSVCITHAGLNTVLESLTQGVPQVAIPVTYDQPGVAARIVEKQTGVVTSLDKLTADNLSMLLDEVLNNPTYRDNARKLQKAIAKTNGLSMAAGLVEQALGVTPKGNESLTSPGFI